MFNNRKTKYLTESFKDIDTPVLNATIVEEWGRWDGPTSGVCEVEGEQFYFHDVVESIWRYYSKDDLERLWRIYAVYDAPLKLVKKLRKKNEKYVDFVGALEDESEIIGIFW